MIIFRPPPSQKKKPAEKKRRGQALVETIVTLPLLMGVGMGILQFALIFEAKLALNHAALMTARTGAVTRIDIDRMQDTFSKHLVPILAPELQSGITPPAQTYQNTIFDLKQGINNPDPALNIAMLRIVNPTQEAFDDFGDLIPNIHLSERNNAIGLNSQVSIQEANVLRVQVAYGLPLIVPFVGNLIIDSYSFYFCELQTCDLESIGNPGDNFRWWVMLQQGLFPVQAVATVRMQSSPERTPNGNDSFIMTRAQVLACSSVGNAGNCFTP